MEYKRKEDVGITIKKASMEHTELIVRIVQTTMKMQYPKYYPQGAVELFLSYQTSENVKMSIQNEEAYLLEEEGQIIGTGSIKENRICRMAILPDYQGKGLGTAMIDFLENAILEKGEEVELDASLVACELYRKRGYETIAYKKLRAENGDFLCYPIMRLRKKIHTFQEKNI